MRPWFPVANLIRNKLGVTRCHDIPTLLRGLCTGNNYPSRYRDYVCKYAKNNLEINPILPRSCDLLEGAWHLDVGQQQEWSNWEDGIVQIAVVNNGIF